METVNSTVRVITLVTRTIMSINDVGHDDNDDGILIRSNKMQQYAGIYLLQIYSTCFGCPSHSSSGEHKTVTAASGTGLSIWATTFLQRGQI